MGKIIYVVLIALLVIIAFGLSGLVFWGLGNLVIVAFRLSYAWSYLQGLVTSLILTVLGGILRGTNR